MLFLIIGIFFFLLLTLKLKKRFSAACCFAVIIAGTVWLLDPLSSLSAGYLFKNEIHTPEKSIYNPDAGFENASVIKIKERVLIDAPLIKQLPELPRGCEVTSLAMLLRHANVNADKMTLAEQIKKEPSPYRTAGGKIFSGNPHDGFVGNMYSFSEPGLGVYHGPIAELANQYLPGRIMDLTGSDFTELKIHLSDQRPVWVIINAAYKKLPETSFETWHTPSGKIRITYREHSVLITGYDENYVYFNDPLTGEKNKRADLAGFEEAWVQMGRQAITYLNH